VTLPVPPARTEPAAAAGPLPDFLVIGAPKAGTTSLAAHLAAHPGVHVAPQKEVDFFQRNWDRGLDWYRAQFAAAQPGQIAGEATPWYLAHPLAPQRIAQVIPQVRMVALLRNPADRAYSQFWWQRAHRTETRSFEQAVADEMRDPALHPRGMPMGYLACSRYMEQVRRVLEHFPREALLVLLMEDLSRDATATFAAVCRHIGADDGVVPGNVDRRYNAAFEFRSMRLWRAMRRYRAWKRLGHPLANRLDQLNRRRISYPPMSAEARRQLVDYFGPFNAELAAWLGRDLSAWDRLERA